MENRHENTPVQTSYSQPGQLPRASKRFSHSCDSIWLWWALAEVFHKVRVECLRSQTVPDGQIKHRHSCEEEENPEHSQSSPQANSTLHVSLWGLKATADVDTEVKAAFKIHSQPISGKSTFSEVTTSYCTFPLSCRNLLYLLACVSGRPQAVLPAHTQAVGCLP